MRILLHSPKDLIAGALAFAAVSAIVANAMFMQAGHHPSPMFGTTFTAPANVSLAPANPLPRPRPAEAALKPADVKLAEVRPAEVRPADVKPAAPVSVIAKTNPAPVQSAARPPAPIPISSRSDPVGDLIIASRCQQAPCGLQGEHLRNGRVSHYTRNSKSRQNPGRIIVRR